VDRQAFEQRGLFRVTREGERDGRIAELLAPEVQLGGGVAFQRVQVLSVKLPLRTRTVALLLDGVVPVDRRRVQRARQRGVRIETPDRAVVPRLAAEEQA